MNDFQQWQDSDGPDFDGTLMEIENHLVRQAETFSFFGKVVELFVPNALNTVVRIIGGEQPNRETEGNNRRSTAGPEGVPDWRERPTRAGAGSGQGRIRPV